MSEGIVDDFELFHGKVSVDFDDDALNSDSSSRTAQRVYQSRSFSSYWSVGNIGAVTRIVLEEAMAKTADQNSSSIGTADITDIRNRAPIICNGQ